MEAEMSTLNAKDSKAEGKVTHQQQIAERLDRLEGLLRESVAPAIIQCAMGREIMPFIQSRLREHVACPYTVGCAAYITNRSFLQELSLKTGVCIITMPPADQQPFNVSEWSAMRPVGDSGPVMLVKYHADAHGNTPLMHHKFLLGLDKGLTPQWVITGSFNFTYNAASRNDENIIFTNEPLVVKRYYTEFLRLYATSSKPRSTNEGTHRPSLAQTTPGL